MFVTLIYQNTVYQQIMETFPPCRLKITSTLFLSNSFKVNNILWQQAGTYWCTMHRNTTGNRVMNF